MQNAVDPEQKFLANLRGIETRVDHIPKKKGKRPFLANLRWIETRKYVQFIEFIQPFLANLRGIETIFGQGLCAPDGNVFS